MEFPHEPRVIVFGYASEDEIRKLPRAKWNTLEVVQPKKTLRVDNEWLPDELHRDSSPLTGILTRPECREQYEMCVGSSIERQRRSDDPERWRTTLKSIRAFIEANIREKETSIHDVYLAWAERFQSSPATLISKTSSRRIGPSGNTQTVLVVQTLDRARIGQLTRSGLFLPGLRTTGEVVASLPISAIAGAISAYLDALFLANVDPSQETWKMLLNATLEIARSGRRANFFPSARQTIGWLTLLIAVHEASDHVSDHLIDKVANTDVSIAFDLHALRSRLNGTRAECRNVIWQTLDHAFRHRNGIPILFKWPIMDLLHRSSRPRMASKPDITTAKNIFNKTNDLDLFVTLLISCAIPGEKKTIDHFWNRILPPALANRLKAIKRKLRRHSIAISKHARISIAVVSLDDLVTVFPGIRRCHRVKQKIALFPWLSAFVLARACGGRLPRESELRKLPRYKKIQAVVLRDSELPDDADDEMLVPRRWEWLETTGKNSKPTGREFTFKETYIEFMDWQVKYASWTRPELYNSKAFVDLPMETAALPDRSRLAACRIVFED